MLLPRWGQWGWVTLVWQVQGFHLVYNHQWDRSGSYWSSPKGCWDASVPRTSWTKWSTIAEKRPRKRPPQRPDGRTLSICGWMGCCTGLNQLHKAWNDVKHIQKSFANVSKDWRQSLSATQGHEVFRDPQEHLRPPDCEGDPWSHWTRGFSSSLPEADQPGVLTLKKGWHSSSPTWTVGTCTTWPSPMTTLGACRGSQMSWSGRCWWCCRICWSSSPVTPLAGLSRQDYQKEEKLTNVYLTKKGKLALYLPRGPRIARRNWKLGWKLDC